jgi:acyl-CoA thioester hydrolase
MPPLSIFSYTFTVPQSAIDEYGHVNNVIYVQWMQDAAIQRQSPNINS